MEVCIPLSLTCFSPVSFLVPEASMACEKENKVSKLYSSRDKKNYYKLPGGGLAQVCSREGCEKYSWANSKSKITLWYLCSRLSVTAAKLICRLPEP